MADIFISYSRKDHDRVEYLVEALTTEGYQVWWDLEIRAGESCDRIIETRLEQVGCVLAVWSKQSVTCERVRAESAWAKDHHKLVSIRIDEELKLPMKFYHFHTTNMVVWKGSRDAGVFRKLVEDIRKIANRTSAQPLPAAVACADESPADGAGARTAPNPRIPAPEMVRIPAGAFLMGCPDGESGSDYERPQREVHIARPFRIGKFAVTFQEYDAFAEATARGLPMDEGWGRGRRPVINVSWHAAVAYAHWLSVETGNSYRLPTEAEWEYAARGGTTTPYSTGECIDTDKANYNGFHGWRDCPESGVFRNQTVDVGSLPANPWGLHEVHGNVLEWVQDCWNAGYKGWLRRAPADGAAWESGRCSWRVVRGGSWFNTPENIRSAFRYGNSSVFRGNFLGFRLAQDL